MGMDAHSPSSPKSTQQSDKSDQSDKLSKLGTSDENLQAELNSYAAALRQEFQESQARNTVPDVERHTRDFFKRNVQDAALQVVWLAHNSDSDSIRLKACTFIIKEAFDASTHDGDPIVQLMRELTAPAKSSHPYHPQHPQTPQTT